jgi:DNA-binding response OmpR family regulator
MDISTRKRILIVDDAKSNLRILIALLNSTYDISVATSGSQALDFALRKQPDLILLDIRMDGMDGYEVCKELKKNQQTEEIPVIFLTGLKDSKNKTIGFEAGAIDYITKPFDNEEILARLKTHLSNYQRPKSFSSQTGLSECQNHSQSNKNTRQDNTRNELLRKTSVDLLKLSLYIWERLTDSDKIELAEKSKIWLASIDKCGTYRTRTLDRYLRQETLPMRPKFRDIVDTAYFVQKSCTPPPELALKLTNKIKDFENMLERSEYRY